MKALVIDQNTITCGFAVVAEDPNTPISFGVTGRLLAHGRITTPAKAGLVDRLGVIEADLEDLIQRHKPQEMVIENTMFFKQKTAQTNHGMAAVYHLCQELAHKHRMAFYTQNPGTIKKHVTGNGSATKDEVLKAVLNIWGMSPYRIKDDNHADALAGAYLWLYQGDEVRAKRKWKHI